MNYLMPRQGVLSLHSSVNQSIDQTHKSITLFFGLSGTGKTTLSADTNRQLIGDDEHCWDENGLFNIEGGCYAKCIHLSPSTEPQIYNAIKYGTVLENCVMNKTTREIDYSDDYLTPNTRACYPISYIPNAVIPCVTGHPTNLILLTCDAFGILPPVSVLNSNQLLYHFISGYTSKVSGTEQGVLEPEATFSACYGEAFIVHHPLVYAKLLQKQVESHNVKCWLVNTGWSGGNYKRGNRIELCYTRYIINAIHNPSSTIHDSKYYLKMPKFGFFIPSLIEKVPNIKLVPWNEWNEHVYEEELTYLVNLFKENFKKYNMKKYELSGGPV